MPAVLTIWGDPNSSQYISFHDIEITSYTEIRWSPTPGSHPEDIDKGRGVSNQGKGIRMINCVVWNMLDDAIPSFQSAKEFDLFGTAIYYNGWNAEDRPHGSATYEQNDTSGSTVRKVRSNVIFQNFYHGLRVSGDPAKLIHFDLNKNVSFNNGFATLYRNSTTGNYSWKGGSNLFVTNGATKIRCLDNHIFSGGLMPIWITSAPHRMLELFTNQPIMEGIFQ